MNGVATRLLATERFYRDYEVFVGKREKLKRVFCESRLELLEDEHRASGSELRLDDWLVKSPRPTRHPWETMVGYSGEEPHWQILFTDPLKGLRGRAGFVEFFNTFLQEKGLNAQLYDIVTMMYFAR